ncbi:uncharacterized protein PSFLO_02377 [Pseudozyma flocculosa]|uniref:Uncharacterized protein n=1 Tax=Pseudozyma flocculosa TaxID=84751 RepID=A0A5C3EZ57_9BASI|nr:uncharacterized protein PSFLO_02377 [Pseudozyma flocculosa]
MGCQTQRKGKAQQGKARRGEARRGEDPREGIAKTCAARSVRPAGRPGRRLIVGPRGLHGLAGHRHRRPGQAGRRKVGAAVLDSRLPGRGRPSHAAVPTRRPDSDTVQVAAASSGSKGLARLLGLPGHCPLVSFWLLIPQAKYRAWQNEGAEADGSRRSTQCTVTLAAADLGAIVPMHRGLQPQRKGSRARTSSARSLDTGVVDDALRDAHPVGESARARVGSHDPLIQIEVTAHLGTSQPLETLAELASHPPTIQTRPWLGLPGQVEG